MDGNTSRARELFHEITTSHNPAEFIRGMIGKPENDYLEFKGGGRGNLSERDAKAAWSQALSGFANTEGGVLIWGVRCAPDPTTKIDAASELDLIANPTTFAQMLKNVSLEATVGPVSGVDFAAYPAEPDGSGFLVCLIPEGNQKPYRAELDPKRQYYQRVGDKYVIISHPFLRSLFYPKTHVQLAARIDALAEGCAFNERRFDVFIENVGVVSAREQYARLEADRPMDHVDVAYGVFEMTERTTPDEPSFWATFLVKQTLHPGQSARLCVCRHSESNHGGTILGSITFRLKLHMLDNEPEEFAATLDYSELQRRSTSVTAQRIT